MEVGSETKKFLSWIDSFNVQNLFSIQISSFFRSCVRFLAKSKIAVSNFFLKIYQGFSYLEEKQSRFNLRNMGKIEILVILQFVSDLFEKLFEHSPFLEISVYSKIYQIKKSFHSRLRHNINMSSTSIDCGCNFKTWIYKFRLIQVTFESDIRY